MRSEAADVSDVFVDTLTRDDGKHRKNNKLHRKLLKNKM